MKKMASIRQKLVHIGKLNLLLADELAKLPEIQWFKTDSSRLAPDRFDHMFAQMRSVKWGAYYPPRYY